MDICAKDEELLSLINQTFERIPFHKFLGLKVESISPDCMKTSFEMRYEFMGNYKRGMLHGGVISAVIDATGGLATFVGSIEKTNVKGADDILRRSHSLSTIDMRVDFLRPGICKRFVVTAYTLRTGMKVVVTRIALHNEEHDLIAVGTGSYLVV